MLFIAFIDFEMLDVYRFHAIYHLHFHLGILSTSRLEIIRIWVAIILLIGRIMDDDDNHDYKINWVVMVVNIITYWKTSHTKIE